MIGRIRWVAAIAAGVLVAGACGGGGEGGGATTSPTATGAVGQRGGELVVGLDSDATTLDPAVDSGYAGTQITAQIFDTLLTVGDDGQIQPGLAESWEQPDATTLVLHLREGVTFHDGTPFDADAVVYNLDRIRDPNSGSTWQGDLAPIDSVTATDPLTVEITLQRPYAPLLAVLADQPGMMISPTAHRADPEGFGDAPVGTGPFVLEERIPDERTTLVRNEDYWQEGLPYLDRVVFRPIPDPTTKITDLLSGAVDIVDYVPPQLIERVRQAPGVVYDVGPENYAAAVYVPMNPDAPPLDDPDVRRAISMAIDRRTIVDQVAFGAGVPANQMIAPSSWAYNPDLPQIAYDPEGARELLGGRTIRLEMQVPPTYVQVAQVIQQNLAAAGIEATIERMDWGTLIDNYYAKNYQIQVQDILGLTRSDPDGVLYGFFAKDGSLNGTGYTTPEIQRLLEQARTETDQATRAGLYHRVLELADAEALYAPVYHPANNRAWTEDLQGVEIKPDSVMDLATVWLQGG
jgi:peptide/nickel transport system substrate-binding protein